MAASEPNSAIKIIDQSVRQSKNFTISFWLISVYLLTIGTSILLLGSYQIQKRIEFFEVNEQQISIWRLDEMSEYLENYKKTIDLLEDKIAVERQRYNEVEAARKAADRAYDVQFDKFRSELTAFESSFLAIFPNTTFTYKNQPASVNTKTIFGRVKKDVQPQLDFIALEAPAPDGDGNSQASISPRQQLLQQWKSLENTMLDGYQGYQKVISIKKHRNSIGKQLEAMEAERIQIAERVREGITPFDEDKGELSEADLTLYQNAVSEFANLKTIFFKVPYKLALVPSELLVLFLVLAMGALGSTIFITQVFFQQQKRDLGIVFYASRPFFGATIALAIFVLAKAGVLFLTDTADGQARPNLSPFFISFIAIISGLMSEQAIMTIREAGHRWFKQHHSESARWAVNVPAVLKEKGRNAEDFANAVGVDLDKVNAWLNQKEKVPLEMQRMLSAWLETKPNLIFTDIAPDEDFNEKKADEK